MEYILPFVTMAAFCVATIAMVVAAIMYCVPSTPKHKASEIEVSNALGSLANLGSYVIFNNLVLRSNGNTPYTEIDHVVVSPYGIFCIETKSHQGSIYGYEDTRYWAQYLGDKKYNFYNPLKQNYAHRMAIESLLGQNINAPVHTYLVFTNARRITINGQDVSFSIKDVLGKIANHKNQVYSPYEYERILKSFAYASSKRSVLTGVHRQQVKEYLSAAAP